MKKTIIILLLLCGSLFAQFTESTQYVIADTDSFSSVIDLGNKRFFGLYIPSSFDGSAVTVYTSETTTGTFQPVYNEDDGAISFSVTAGRRYKATPTDYFMLQRYIKLKSGSAASGADTGYVYTGTY